MKVIGLIGGMSWESTVPYYQHINRAVRDRLGGHSSARIILYSVDFAEIERLQQVGAWDEAGRALASTAVALQDAGAEFLVLCTNTMHKVALAIEAAVRIPLLHIADATAAAVKARGFTKVGVLGTRFTMEQDFYTGRLAQSHGLKVVIPEAEDRRLVHDVIYEELCQGLVRAESREKYVGVVHRLAARGAQAVILGCTEISLLVTPEDSPLPVFDTTAIHALAAAEHALMP
ncbi:MAG: aspartate/glutamate racemase family protein [Minicystis sp.]